jgi:aldehyde:ferredoxin oxidoreductase
MYQGGYTGKVLRINLTDQTAKEETLPVEIAKDFIGGAGFAIKYLYDEVKAGTDPLGPDNKLVFAVGPFSGTTIPCSTRMAVAGKSPLTSAMGLGLSGGHFPAELKFAGYDVLIIEGKAEKPTYVWIKEGETRFRTADKAWGTKTTDCQQIIKNELHDQNVRVACIGPAGENLCRIACIINEMRAVGRKGLGAVMGSKNLKAIAVRGTRSVGIADEGRFKVARGAMTKAMKESPYLYSVFSKHGTSLTVDATCALGIFPTKNYSATGDFAPIEKIGVEALKARSIGREACYMCPVGCSQLRLARTEAYAGILSEGPEFETVYSLGGQTGVDNLDSIIAGDRLADELGLDTISAGVTIGFAMELYERGILDRNDTGGLELKFGNHHAMITLLRWMAFREGIGDLLADGVKVAAAKIGQGVERFAMHVKGLELPGYDVRGAKAHGLNYATSYTGADHNRGYATQEIFGSEIPYPVNRFALEGKGKLTMWNQDMTMAVADCPALCGFITDIIIAQFGTGNMADLVEGLTGLKFTKEEIQEVGERVNNLARAFNVREGFGRVDDTLPERIRTEPIKAGPSKGQFVSQEDLNQMLDEYYAERGWDVKTGIPTREKLVELGLRYVADELGVR